VFKPDNTSNFLLKKVFTEKGHFIIHLGYQNLLSYATIFTLCPFFVKIILIFLFSKIYRFFLDIFSKKKSFEGNWGYFCKKRRKRIKL